MKMFWVIPKNTYSSDFNGRDIESDDSEEVPNSFGIF